jgi:hypothetical protein
MQQTIDLDQLRTQLLEAPESEATRILAILLSAALLIVVLLLVRRRTLREEYTPIWVLVALTITIVSLRFDLLRGITRAIGAWTPSSTLFFLGEVFLVLICLNYAVRLSVYGSKLKNLAQETAILRARLDELQEAASAEVQPETGGEPHSPST